MSGLTWRKSSMSGSNGACVEVAVAGDSMLVRDSKDPRGGNVHVPSARWQSFLHEVKAGRYDN